MLLTDIGSQGDGGRFARKGKDSDDWANRNYDKKSKPRAGTFVAIQNEKGQVFYKPIDDNITQNIIAQIPQFQNLSLIKSAKRNAAKEASRNLGAEKESMYTYRDLKRDNQSMGRIRQQVQMATGNPNTTKYDAAAISYYTHVKNMNGAKIDDLVKIGDFNKMVQAASDTPELKARLDNIMRNPKSTSYDLVKFIIDNTEYDGAESWLRNLKYIETVKHSR